MTFLARLAAQPADATALLVRGRPVTYGELRQQAAMLGTALRDVGVGPETLVGLAVDRADFVAELLGIWWAGGAFVPLDVRWPKERFAFIVRDANLKYAIATGERADWLRELGVHVLEPQRHALSEPHTTQPHDLAYVIYTSGSTGQPKGVLVEHRGLVNLCDEQIRAFQLGPTTRSLWMLSPAFDASVSDIGTALLAGGTLVIEADDALRNPDTLLQLLHERGITYIDLPPLFLTLLNRDALPSTLRTICIGGEPAAPDIVQAWAERIRLVNAYGPTEATVCSSLGICAPSWDAPLLGQPLANVQYAVVDEELRIAGISLARGYLNRPELTAAKFITENGTRWYRTGDRVEIVGGEYVFRGRLDRQFKLRGQLIEPEEVERRLCEHPAITQAAVVKHGDGPTAQLVAFLVVTTPLTSADLRTHLRQSVPLWMVPNVMVFLGALPRTTSGKVAYDVLASWPMEAGANEPLSADALEATLQQLWQRVLQRPIACDAGFLSQGGDSLRVLQCLAYAQAEGIALAPHVLADDRPLAAVAQWLRAKKPHTDTRLTADLECEAEALVATLPPARTSGIGVGVLLTGATGFLGQRVLRELRSRGIHVTVLVRDRQRLPDEHRDYVTVFEGDLARPHFGLDAATWSTLTHTIGAVWHLGAAVNMVAPYAALRGANVEGTANVVRFMAEGCAKQLHYASTLSVFVATDRTTGICYEADDLRSIREVHGGYAQSKFVAERFLRLLGGRYGPVVQCRFGQLTDPSQPHTTDFLSVFLRALRQLRSLPLTANLNLVTDCTPLEYAASAFVHLALQPHADGTTFHIANATRTTLADLIIGEPIEMLPADEWERRLTALRATDPAGAALVQGVFATPPTWDLFQAGSLHFDTTNTRKVLFT